MKNPKYPYCVDKEMFLFTFQSVGPKGLIKKMVEFSRIEGSTAFTMAFGDYDELRDGLDDMVVTNNRDTTKVLSTVASVIYTFTENYPDAEIFVIGSTMSRNRLYRMIFANYTAEFHADFFIFGHIVSGNWELFRSGKNYDGYILARKTKHYKA